jgi:hypothetical protein
VILCGEKKPSIVAFETFFDNGVIQIGGSTKMNVLTYAGKNKVGIFGCFLFDQIHM